jgi:two-component system, NtrC family, sensor kinase
MSDLPINQLPPNACSEPSQIGLQKALTYAQSIVETVREPLIVLDADLRVKSANRSFYKTFHVLPEETEHQLIDDLGNGQWSIPALKQLLQEILDKNTQFEDFEVEHEFQHIGRKNMLLNARQIFQDSTQNAMILLAIEDITERKQTEAALKLFTTRLERSNRELQDFASVASHDLQEPLRKIQAFGDLLKHECHDGLTDAGQQYLQRMQNAAIRMQTLINDLLAFSRVTTKAQPFVRCNLADIVQEVLSDLEVRIQQVGGQVEVGDLPTIEADPLQLRQLLQNLMSNSLKFHQPTVPAQVKLYAQKLGGQSSSEVRLTVEMWQIFVEDNGIGFDEKYLDRIFTIFQRLHYRDEYEGTGIGLAICRKIVERHNGSITAKSKPGVGSTFIVTLPASQPNDKPVT